MKRFLKDIEQGDTFRVAGVETDYTAEYVFSLDGQTRVLYNIDGVGRFDMTKPALSHIVLVSSPNTI